MSEIQGKPVFGICECKEKRQVLSVEQAIDLIQQMAANNWQVPTDYIPKTSVNGIVEQHYGDELKLWVGTQAEYDALTDEERTNCFALISDDPTYKSIQTELTKHNQSIENLNERLEKLGFREGSITVSPLVTATLNKITRQGNYVIGKLAGTIYLSNGTYETIGTLPSDFLPPEEITQDIVLSSGSYGWGSVDIGVDGNIGVFIRPGITVSSNTISFEIPFGYEAKPIS